MNVLERSSPPPAKAATVPAHRVVVLGAGRNIRGHLPSAMVTTDEHHRVLDWLLAAFGVLPAAEVYFVSGYMAETVTARYPDIRFFFNPDWAVTGPAKSLSLVPLACSTATYVSYSDVVFRPDSVVRMAGQTADVVLAVDTRWRVRYEGRSRTELDHAEKILSQGPRLVDVGKHVPTDDATAELAGLMKLSPPAATRLQTVITSGLFSEQAGLPEIIQFFIREGASISLVDVNGDWAELNAPQDLARFVLGTKAESLERLKPLVRIGKIPDLVSFTHEAWSQDPDHTLGRIQAVFPEARLIVRSSARHEDTWHHSSAGAHKSVSDIPANDRGALTTAIEDVIASYGDPHSQNQVLIQEVLREVTVSGVVMTRTPSPGGPYYVINFDATTSRTDTVTSGTGQELRTVFLHRGDDLRSDVPPELPRLLEVVHELEALVGHDALDIEFAFTRGGVAHILQVRPLIVQRHQPVDDVAIADGLQEAIKHFRQLQTPTPFVLGRTTRFSVMSDWNPAEMIGTKPKRLAYSLYRYLLTDDVWAQQRAEYGYRDVRPCHLLVDFLGHPYVDVRATFNSFIPASLPQELATRLVEYYLAQLASQPALHDKVEFEVLVTCFTLDFDERAQRLRQHGFSQEDITLLRQALMDITRGGMARCADDVSALDALSQRFASLRSAELPPLQRAFLLLEDARRLGTPRFAHLARGAFVAVSLLRSLVRMGVVSPEHMNALLASLRTVASTMQDDASRVASGGMAWEAFLEQYGHLRPGTYDITSPCYASAPEEYLRPIVRTTHQRNRSRAPAPWDAHVTQVIGRALAQAGIDRDGERFERFLRQAIEGREFGKFLFTRNLSAALEDIATWGATRGVPREELAHLRIQDLLELQDAGPAHTAKILRHAGRLGQEAFYITQAVCLPGQIASESDFTCLEQIRAEPNFVTSKTVRAPLLLLPTGCAPDVDPAGKIILIPHADPGYDWLFARGIAGLITKYGGVNSHMAVRAAEFQLPAAIGVDELLYQNLAQAEFLELDCSSRQITIVR